MQSNPQVPWTEEQWARVNQAIQEEAQRVRVAATFLPLYGPLPADTDFVRKVDIPAGAPLTVNDTTTIELSTLQLQLHLRGAQLADPEMGSVLSAFRRAANIIARWKIRLCLTDALTSGYSNPRRTDNWRPNIIRTRPRRCPGRATSRQWQ